MNFKALISEFITYCEVERRFEKNTIKAYKSDLEGFNSFSNQTYISDILTVKNFKSYLKYIVSNQNLSPSTARRRIACLRALCTFAESRYKITNPFNEWTPSIKRPKRLPRALSTSEISLLISPDYRMSSIENETIFCICLMSATGLRVSELCSIRLCDTSSDGTSIHILGKGSKDRIVYVSNRTLQEEIVKRRLSRSNVSPPSSPLLINSRSNPLQPQTMRRRLHKLTSKLGMEKIVTPHMLRHTAATLLIENGTDIRFVQRLLGHASIATTEIYTYVSDPALKKAILEADTLGSIMP